MRKLGIKGLSIFCFLGAISCSPAETALELHKDRDGRSVTVFPTPENVSALKPIVTKVNLTSKQRRNLDAALPPSVREILENAETFEVLMEDRGRDVGNDGNTFEPNRVARLTLENDKRTLLEAFYKDASSDDGAASCYEPHHGFRATYQGKTVEIEICYDCAQFYVTGTFGKFEGTIKRDGRKSENIVNQIVQNYAVEIDK
ncbi:MAG: hypothetical protein JNL64_15620 [Blastocatellia bacterium]|nr:hypothetical protein [Blastocatellia bacterium]